MNIAASLARVLREEQWTAGPAGGTHIRLAGGTIDNDASLVSDVLVFESPFNMVSVRTRLPLLVPRRDAEAAAGFCLAINASSCDGVLTIRPAGTPELISKRTLPEPEKQAASLIVTTVNENRAYADALIGPLLSLSRGATPETVLAGTPAAGFLPLSREPRSAASLLPGLPVATDDNGLATQLTDLEMTELEAAAFGAYVLLQDTLEGSPVCAGPVLIHADGTIECYGCSQPNSHLHPGGTSISCAAGYSCGPGHQCERCWTAP